jgi:Ca2+-binding RTX toxin-like protein
VGDRGNNTLDGGSGADDMTGGLGGDTYIVDNPNDVVHESVSLGDLDTVITSVSYVLPTGGEIEALTASGTNPINLTGNEFAQTITGNSGDNIIDGMGGVDDMRGAGGNDVYFVDNVRDTVREAVGGGTDRIFASVSFTLSTGSAVELMSTTSHDGTQAINITGNDLNNTIYGNAGNNILDGQGGVDELVGLGGNDTYFVDNANDRVDESVGGGNDQVFTSASFNLTEGQEIERLQTTNNAGTQAINLRGNDFDNLVVGNDGNNVISGGAGNDILYGLGGNDRFVFEFTPNNATNIDQIVDFTVGSDLIMLASQVFTGLGTQQFLADANFLAVGSRGQDADDRVLYDASNGALYFDADGNGAGAAITFAFITPGTNLHASDIFVV